MHSLSRPRHRAEIQGHIATYLPRVQVQHGFWEDLNLSPRRGSVYSQMRLRIILRSLIRQLLHPIRMGDGEDPKSLQNLSQIDAIKALLWPDVKENDGSMVFVSHWFGTASVITAILLIIIGSIIPYYLTGAGGISPMKS